MRVVLIGAHPKFGEQGSQRMGSAVCPNCSATISPQAAADGWCEKCEKRIPAFALRDAGTSAGGRGTGARSGGPVGLASRFARLRARLLDGEIGFVAAGPALLLVRYGQPALGLLVGGLAGLVIAWVQLSRLAEDGQTLGKRAVGVQIDATEGRAAGFVRVVLVRTLLVDVVVAAPTVLGYGVAVLAVVLERDPLTPLLGGLLASLALELVDVLPALGGSRRCLHDYLAGTRVVWARGS